MIYPSVRQLTVPATQNLISLSQVKLYFRDTTTANDAIYTSLIEGASSSMIQFLGLDPSRQRYEERSRGNGNLRRHLSRLPVEPGTLTIHLGPPSPGGLELSETTDESTVDPGTFILENPATGRVYRPLGWCGYGGSPTNWSSLSGLDVTDTYYAGFILPDQISTWTASVTHKVGSWVRATAANLLRFEATAVTGASGSTEPTWPTTIGGTVTDGGVTWTARAARELPAAVTQWCWAEVLRLHADLNWSPNLVTRTVMGNTESRFARKVDDGALAPTTMSGLESWRRNLGKMGVA